MNDNATSKIRILIADDHAIVREGLRYLFMTEPDIDLVGEAEDGEAAVRLYNSLEPEVALIDLMMPRKDGVSAIREIRECHPHARILVLTSFAEDDQILPAVRAGALGYLLKDASPAELLRAIREVHAGQSYLQPAIARRVLHELRQSEGDTPRPDSADPDALSARESEVLNLLAEGLSNQDIADRLVISERTVRNHVGNILGKLHLDNRTQAALYAVRLAGSDSRSQLN